MTCELCVCVDACLTHRSKPLTLAVQKIKCQENKWTSIFFRWHMQQWPTDISRCTQQMHWALTIIYIFPYKSWLLPPQSFAARPTLNVLNASCSTPNSDHINDLNSLHWALQLHCLIHVARQNVLHVHVLKCL